MTTDKTSTNSNPDNTSTAPKTGPLDLFFGGKTGRTLLALLVFSFGVFSSQGCAALLGSVESDSKALDKALQGAQIMNCTLSSDSMDELAQGAPAEIRARLALLKEGVRAGDPEAIATLMQLVSDLAACLPYQEPEISPINTPMPAANEGPKSDA